jgi:hypothetical protein
MTALEVLDAVKRAGGQLIAHGDKITMEAAAPLPADLIVQVRHHKPALLAILRPIPPRHAGGLEATEPDHSCAWCGGIAWKRHVTYDYCLTCGREDGPGAVMPEREDITTPGRQPDATGYITEGVHAPNVTFAAPLQAFLPHSPCMEHWTPHEASRADTL